MIGWLWSGRDGVSVASRIALCTVLFVGTGIIQTVAVQTLLYSGGSDSSTLLVALPQYVGNSLVYFCGNPVFRFMDKFFSSRTSSDSSSITNESSLPTAAHEPSKPRKIPFYKLMFHPERRQMFTLSINELCGFVSGLIGLGLAGSGLYQVVMSGATIFCALLARLFLGKKLSWFQWISIGVISLGLTLTTVSNPFSSFIQLLSEILHPISLSVTQEYIPEPTHNISTQVLSSNASFASSHIRITTESTTSNTSTSSNVLSGTALTLVSCLFFSLNYILADYFLSEQTSENQYLDSSELPPVKGMDLSLYTGFTALGFCSTFVLFHTVPRWNELVVSSIRNHHGRLFVIISCHILHMAASFIHAITYFDLMANVGAIPIGVMNAVRAVSVFAVSAFLFCERQTSQCYTSQKGLATIVVVSGALAYTFSPSLKNVVVEDSSNRSNAANVEEASFASSLTQARKRRKNED
mmetsp:Transcript_2398/g.4203  ORF Transcript_2398/g.4203 Transcript_2398/m.4203 type:complete len:468 (-) Transcript_2398:37-1440(-)